MARGASQSQTAGAVPSAGSRPGIVGPRGTPAAAAAGMRRRRAAGGGGSGGAFGGGGASNMLRFYTDEAPGIKMSPTVVLVMSLCFIGFVTALHVFGKLYRHRSGAGDGP
ncbi:hypothetical protein Taro_038538 [Colocasia esculenta]|uniref:Protein transport protein Sec61 subunit beta n=1 Tax=Colocasia esculenta TaxID=4460 RepID=A0A843WD37_COLES|nr:hypothetical protein [Colocasia esculenta]